MRRGAKLRDTGMDDAEHVRDDGIAGPAPAAASAPVTELVCTVGPTVRATAAGAEALNCEKVTSVLPGYVQTTSIVSGISRLSSMANLPPMAMTASGVFEAEGLGQDVVAQAMVASVVGA